MSLLVACMPDFGGVASERTDAGIGATPSAAGSASDAGSAGTAAPDGGDAAGAGGVAGSSTGAGGSGSSGGREATAGVGGSNGIDPTLNVYNEAPDPSFEVLADAWVPWNTHTVERTQVGPCSGNWCLVAKGRTEEWMGPAMNLLSILDRGVTYRVAVWVRVTVPSSPLALTLKTLCREASDTITSSRFDPIGSFAVSDRWSEVAAPFTVPVCAAPNELQDLELIIEGPLPDVDIYVDDITIEER